MNSQKFPFLYKKAKNGKISIWKIYVESLPLSSARIIISHGYTDGVLQEEILNIYEGKNLGRANATTAYQQAIFEARSRYEKQEKKGYTEDPSGEAKMDVILPMLAQKYSERAKYITFPCYVQPKLNGLRCISYIKDGKRVYQSRLGTFWTTLEHLTPQLEAFGELILDGEIYLPGLDLQDINSLVKNTKEYVDINGVHVEDLDYWIYDIVDTGLIFEARHKILKSFFDKRSTLSYVMENIIDVETSLCLNETDLYTFHILNLRDSHEGTMLRNAKGLYAINQRSNDLQKLKPKLDAEFEIVGGYEVKTGREQGTCIFTCKTKEGLTFDVRPKGTLERRRKYWKDILKLVGKQLTCEFQEWTSDKKPFHARGVTIRDAE